MLRIILAAVGILVCAAGIVIVAVNATSDECPAGEQYQYEYTEIVGKVQVPAYACVKP